MLDGSEGRHAATVRRIRVGEEIDLADGEGGVAAAQVTAVGRGNLELMVGAVRTAARPDPRIVVVQALLKGDRAELAVELATEAGVDVIVPWAAQRCVAQWSADRAPRHLERWRAAAVAAAKQSRRDWWPNVEPLAGTDDVVRRLEAAGAPLVLHESGTGSLSEFVAPASGDVVLVVGPEGGIADDELARLLAAPARSYRLAPHVFRGSSAGAFASAALSLPLGRWT